MKLGAAGFCNLSAMLKRLDGSTIDVDVKCYSMSGSIPGENIQNSRFKTQGSRLLVENTEHLQLGLLMDS